MDSVYITYISVQFININKQNPRVLTLNTKYPHHTYIKKKKIRMFQQSVSQTDKSLFFLKEKKPQKISFATKSITSSTKKTKNRRKRSKRIAFLPVHKLCCSTRTILIETGFPCTLSAGHAGGISHWEGQIVKLCEALHRIWSVRHPGILHIKQC